VNYECNDIKYETGSIVLRHRGCHLETVYDVITQPRMARFGRNLGTLFSIAHKLLRSGQNSKEKKNSNMADVCFPNRI